MAPRAYWKGALRLSLVTCPVYLFTATKPKPRTTFNQISRATGKRVRHQKVDDSAMFPPPQERQEETTTGVASAAPIHNLDTRPEPATAVLQPDHIVKAVEVEKDHYVTFEQDELDQIELETSRTIDIVRFVPKAQIDDLYYDTPYYIVPDEAGSGSVRCNSRCAG
jgi:DNA end-binding protein Ku